MTRPGLPSRMLSWEIPFFMFATRDTDGYTICFLARKRENLRPSFNGRWIPRPLDNHNVSQISAIGSVDGTPMPTKSQVDDILRRLQKERSLFVNVDADEAYGFRCDVSFAGTLTVTVARRGGRVTLAASLDKRYEPGSREVRKSLDAADWERLLAALRRADFWDLPERHDRLGLDGDTWTIEGRRLKTWHQSECWEPPPGSFRDLGLVFVELSGLESPGDVS